MSSDDVAPQLLRLAETIVGSRRKLAARLLVEPALISCWLQGPTRLPEPVLAEVEEIVVAHHEKGQQPGKWRGSWFAIPNIEISVRFGS